MAVYKIRWLLMVILGHLTCVHVTDVNNVPTNELNDVNMTFISSTMPILELLEHLEESHGASISQILTILLERIRQHAVLEEEALAIKETIRFIDDPKTKEILDIIGGVSISGADPG